MQTVCKATTKTTTTTKLDRLVFDGPVLGINYEAPPYTNITKKVEFPHA